MVVGLASLTGETERRSNLIFGDIDVGRGMSVCFCYC